MNPEDDGKENDFMLYYWDGNGQASLLADNSTRTACQLDDKK
ncbi:MAG: hypothetical protein R2744_02775 [Bacteroidales bacterium]